MKTKYFPKTIKGYISRLETLDEAVDWLKGYDKLSKLKKEVLIDVRSHIAEVIDTFKY